MTYPDLSNFQVVARYLVLARLLVLRKIVSTVLIGASKVLWMWVREQRSRRIITAAAKAGNRSASSRAGTKWPRLAWTGPVVTGDTQEIGIDPGASVNRAATPTS
jgi:hypothetical protein